jgi:hypothetical protein
MTVVKAGPLNWMVPIVDKEGRPTPDFIRWFSQLVGNDGTLDIGKQDADADLTELSALTGTGIAVRSAITPTWVLRSLTAPAAGFTITNPAGVGGDPTFVLANDLAALEALSSTGLAARTGTDAWAQRTLTAPAAGLTIANPAGVAGNPTFALANDLAALEGLSGTHTMYYRSATDTWSAVTVGTGLDFTGATLSCTVSGYTDEQARDAVGTALTAGTGIAITVNDPSDTITIDALLTIATQSGTTYTLV